MSLIGTAWTIRAGSAALSIPNRLAMAPMTRRQAFTNNEPVEAHALYYSRRAKGGVGLIITEGVHVNNTTAVDAPNTPQCRTEGQIAGWRAVAKAVHAEGSKIAMQLWHTGIMSATPVGPAPLAADFKSPFPLKGEVTALTEAQLHEIAADFAATAAGAVKGAGFDAVEIHGAHGYLLDIFTSRAINTRTDGYGPENRFAFPVLVVKAVRAAVGPDVPIIYRFSQWSLLNFAEIKYVDSSELAAFLTALVEAGVDAFHPSTRRTTDVAFPAEHPTRTLGGWVKALSGRPRIAVGGIGLNHDLTNRGATEFVNVDPTPALNLVNSGEVDALALGRMVLTNKDYGTQLMEGKWVEAKAYEPVGGFGVSALDW